MFLLDRFRMITEFCKLPNSLLQFTTKTYQYPYQSFYILKQLSTNNYSPNTVIQTTHFVCLVSIFLGITCVVAQGSADSNVDLGWGTAKQKLFGRRGQIVLKSDTTGLESITALNLDTGLGVFDAFFASLSMILVSEIGDETFIIAAHMAMRHPKSIVLSGALSALYVMTILSTGLGRIVPNLISRKHTNSAATVLYAFFGLRLLYIAWRSDSKASSKKDMEESFILTFLAEWGDRSQIATIALATHKNALGVAVGASLGHTVCASVAVVGGSMLASKISQRTVATVGGLLFFRVFLVFLLLSTPIKFVVLTGTGLLTFDNIINLFL